MFVAAAHVFCRHCENLTSMNIIYFEVYSHNKNQRDALISQICFGIELCMFQTGHQESNTVYGAIGTVFTRVIHALFKPKFCI